MTPRARLNRFLGYKYRVASAIERIERREEMIEYTVEVHAGPLWVLSYTKCKSEQHARVTALMQCHKHAAHPNRHVYVSWFRETDHQQGFLNQDGNHDTTGKAWRL